MAMRPLHHVPREDPDLPRGDLILHFSRRPESTPAGVRETAVGGGGEGGAGQTPDGCGKLLEERAIRGNADGDDPFFFFLGRGTGSRFILQALQAIAGGGGQGEQK